MKQKKERIRSKERLLGAFFIIASATSIWGFEGFVFTLGLALFFGDIQK